MALKSNKSTSGNVQAVRKICCNTGYPICSRAQNSRLRKQSHFYGKKQDLNIQFAYLVDEHEVTYETFKFNYTLYKKIHISTTK